MDPKLYEELNKGWKATCRIVLGEEIGELKEYEEWLREVLPKRDKRKSYISGKEVTFARAHYCDTAKFISFDEAKEKPPLTINEIKDIDSILEAIAERWEYAGNRVLGNSRFVESSDNIVDSQYVGESANVKSSSIVFSSFFVGEGSKYIYGCNWVDKSEFMVKSAGYNVRRCMDVSWADGSSDMYCSFYCMGCNEMMFSFTQRSKRNCIGNLQLQKEKYLDLKRKLLGEIREELQREKTFPSMFTLVGNEKPPKNITVTIKPTKQPSSGDMVPINKAFSTTFRILFKREAPELTQYEDWLLRHIIRPKEVTSPFGTETYSTDVLAEVNVYPKNRLVSQEEALELSNLHLGENQISSLKAIKENISRIGFFIGDLSELANNAIRCPLAFHVSNMYRVNDGNYSENCAVDGQLIHAKYVFGSNRVTDSEFCMNCYSSQKLRRCFEIDTSSNCTDSYFCHNCEGLQEAMFCFNTKGKRYAISNTPLSPDQYRRIKDMLVGQMADEILKKKELKWDIYNIGGYGKR